MQAVAYYKLWRKYFILGIKFVNDSKYHIFCKWFYFFFSLEGDDSVT